jgi:hypothetical protein
LGDVAGSTRHVPYPEAPHCTTQFRSCVAILSLVFVTLETFQNPEVFSCFENASLRAVARALA